MSFDLLADVNWLAVLGAAVAYFVLGALWYMPKPMAAAWTKSMGWDPSEEDQPSAAIYVAPLVTCLVSSVAMAMLAAGTGSDTVAEGLVLGLVAGVGIAAAILMVTGWFDPKKPQPLVWASITAGYHVVGLLITGVIVSAWA